MKIYKLVSNLLESNTFVIEKGEEALIVDCGCNLDVVKSVVESKKVQGILLTHGHYDHAFYCNDYADAFKCKIFANSKCRETLTTPKMFYSPDGSSIKDLSNFEFLNEDCEIFLGAFNIKCFAFPGHSQCCEAFLIEDNLFVGDFLFDKSFGRVDFIGSDKNQMINSFEKFKNIDFTKVYSGHGGESEKEDQIKNIELFKKFLSR